VDTSSVQLAPGDPPEPMSGAGSDQVDTLDTYFEYISPKVENDVTDGEKEYSGSIKL
jgi:hypothetical protein